MDISIIIPTYNEKENIETLVNRIFNSLKNYKFEIIFVDDNSKDGTIEKIKDMSKKNKNIKLIVRKRKMGINSAFIVGYKNSLGKYIVLMDADLQHPPEKIPEMIYYLKKGYDIVVASRFLRKSKIVGLSTLRKLFSLLTCTFIRITIKNAKIKDPLSGFFAIKKEILDTVITKIKFKRGFKILIEILANSERIKIKEIPFIFGVRKYGKSKINKIVLVELLKQIIYYSELIRIIKFYIVDSLGLIVNLGSLYILRKLDIPHLFASGISIELSILHNFMLNNYWTFRDRAKGNFLNRLIKYHFVVMFSASSQYIISNLLFYYMLNNSILAQIIAIFLSAILNLFGSFKFVWKK
ncbi:MAG: glycosyltransferase family 2 protein [Nanopusillaceae archaeon]